MAENGGTRVEYSVCIVAALIVKLNRDFVFISTKCFTRLHYFTLVFSFTVKYFLRSATKSTSIYPIIGHDSYDNKSDTYCFIKKFFKKIFSPDALPEYRIFLSGTETTYLTFSNLHNLKTIKYQFHFWGCCYYYY